MTWKRSGSSSYIIGTRLVTGSCRGFCKGYRNTRIVAEFIGDYGVRGWRFCPTCEHVYDYNDWSKFPNSKYCICCKKQMRTRTKASRTKTDWRKRIE